MGIKLSRCLDAGVTKTETSSQPVATQKPATVADHFEHAPNNMRPQLRVRILDVDSEDLATLSTMSSSASAWDSDSDC